ncbi:hypothetical protein C8J57DRAFT_1346951, partial [Mycena rebaudengoi]
MRSIPLGLLLLPVALACRICRDHHNPTTEIQDGQTGTLIVIPLQATETGLKKIPGKYFVCPWLLRLTYMYVFL